MQQTTSERLKDFKDYYSKTLLSDCDRWANVDFTYTQNVVGPLTSEWSPSSRSHYLGFSQLGNTPSIYLALHNLGFKAPPQPKTPRQRLRFHFGYWFEYTIIEMLRYYDSSLDIEQGTALKAEEFKNANFAGHLDVVLDKTWLLDVKTMQHESFMKFTKEPNNYLGYLTQLSLYKHYYEKLNGVELQAGWLCFDLDTFEIKVVDYYEELHEQIVQAAWKKMEDIDYCDNLQHAHEVCKFPPPKDEVFKGKPTGRSYVPANVWKNPYSRAMYIVEDGVNGYKKPTKYFRRYTTVYEFIDRVQKIKLELGK